MRPIRKAVLPVAGLGTRFLPATKAVPKELLPIIDTPILSYAIEEATQAGITEFIFVIARGKEGIAKQVGHNPDLVRTLNADGKGDLAAVVEASTIPEGRASFIYQDKPMGLGHAIWCARHAVGDEPFAVLLPDDVILSSQSALADLMAAHEAVGGNIAAVIDVAKQDTSKYGILAVEGEEGRMVRASDLVEKPAPEKAPSNVAIIGRYVLEPGIFAALSDTKAGSGDEIQLTDAMRRRIADAPFHGVRIDGTRFDCGTKNGLLEATVAFALAREDTAGTMQRILSSYGQHSAWSRVG